MQGSSYCLCRKNPGSDRRSNLPKGTQLESGRTNVGTQKNPTPKTGLFCLLAFFLTNAERGLNKWLLICHIFPTFYAKDNTPKLDKLTSMRHFPCHTSSVPTLTSKPLWPPPTPTATSSSPSTTKYKFYLKEKCFFKKKRNILRDHAFFFLILSNFNL